MDDDPGPSVAHYFNQDKATENFYRLSQLIMTVCTDLFRDILSRHIKPGELRFELDKNKKKLVNIMNFQQRQLIYPICGNTSLVIKDLDFSVLYIILRNICKISPHLSGWGNNPLPSDKSIAACIDRIRQLRNLISGHSTNGRVEEIEFKNHWTELRNAVVEIEKQSVGGDLYERGVDYLLNCDLPHVKLNTCDDVKDPPNVIMGHDTSLDTNAVRLIAKVFPSDKALFENVFWTKNGVGIDIRRMGRKYSKISTGNPSLTINNVNQQDAGSYQLIAVNSVGSTVSDTVILDVPKIFLEINELKKDRSKMFKVTIQSIPAPMYAQWKIKEKDGDAFELLDVNAEEYMGSQNSLPHPVLFVNHTKHLKTQIFQIEVCNFIGSSRRIITADMPPVILETEKLAVGLETFYDEKGASIRFSNLFHDLAENVPWGKTEQLKDLIQNSCKLEDMLSLKQANSPRDCFRILKDAKLFTSADVIFIQYLLKKMDCTELFEKCCEYAEAQKALCFYEKPPENGFKNVQFHVQGNLSEYSPIQIEKIKETVAVIVGCSSKEIHVGGFLPSTSFLVVLSLKEIYLEKLFNMDQWKKDRLVEVNIDYFIVDLKFIYIDSSKAMECNLYFDPMVRNQSKTENNHKKNQEFQKQEELSSIRPRSIIPKPKHFEYDSDDSGSCSICSDSGVLRTSFSSHSDEEIETNSGLPRWSLFSPNSYSDEETKPNLDSGLPRRSLFSLESYLETEIKRDSGLPRESLRKTFFSNFSCSDEETKKRNSSIKPIMRRLKHRTVSYSDRETEIKTDLRIPRRSQRGTFFKKVSYSDEETEIKTDFGLPRRSLSGIFFKKNSHSDEETKLKTEAINETKEDSLHLHRFTDLHAVDREEIEKNVTSMKELRERVDKLEVLYKRVDKLEETLDCSSPKRKKTSTSTGKLSSEPLYLKSPVLELSIDVPDMLLIQHITGIKSDRLWVGGITYKKEGILKQVDSTGKVIETINDADCSLGIFTITQNGELLYLKKGFNEVQKKTPTGTTTIITTSKDENIQALFSSPITGDVLVGVYNSQIYAGKLTRYDKTGAKIQDIEVDKHGQTLYISPVYIAENKNGDIVTVDFRKHKVLLVDKSGGYRDYYRGQSPKKRDFDPRGVCTDIHGYIMVADYMSGSIHLLDQDLYFLTLLLTKEQHNLESVSALFVDEKHNLYVGSENGRINVYKYLKDV